MRKQKRKWGENKRDRGMISVKELMGWSEVSLDQLNQKREKGWEKETKFLKHAAIAKQQKERRKT